MPKQNTYGDSDDEEDILSVSSDNDNVSDDDIAVQRKNPTLTLFNDNDNDNYNEDIEIEDDEEDENDDIDIGDDENFAGGGNGDESNDEDDGGDFINQNTTNIELSDNYDDDADDDDDENYNQKFNEDVNKKYISDYHPECLIHNYDEINLLTIIVRDTHNIIIDDLHKTLPFLTKYEKARILGQRAKQIDTGATPFVKVPDNIIDGYIIAELELQEKKIPFIIRRPIPGGGSEYWNLKDLENLN